MRWRPSIELQRSCARARGTQGCRRANLLRAPELCVESGASGGRAERVELLAHDLWDCGQSGRRRRRGANRVWQVCLGAAVWRNGLGQRVAVLAGVQLRRQRLPLCTTMALRASFCAPLRSTTVDAGRGRARPVAWPRLARRRARTRSLSWPSKTSGGRLASAHITSRTSGTGAR